MFLFYIFIIKCYNNIGDTGCLMDIDKYFSDYKVNIQSLIPFGFIFENDKYIYNKKLLDGDFEAIISIDIDGNINECVIDSYTKEKYSLLYNFSQNGEFVGSLRHEYELFLKELIDNCFIKEKFFSNYTNDIVSYVKDKYGDDPLFLWEESPNNAVFKHKENSKWYIVILSVCSRKLGIDSDDVLDIINIKNDPLVISSLIDNKCYFKAYHMNKSHWMTIPLDGRVALNDIYNFIDKSYELTKK